MVPKALDFSCALITGGGGGIGRAGSKALYEKLCIRNISEWLLLQGKHVIICGRTESKLKQAAQEMGRGTSFYVLDTGKTVDIPTFVHRVLEDHPDVDCLINNAGIQRPFDFNEGVDLSKADQEIDINIRGPLHLTTQILPHFKSRANGGVIMNVSSVLGFIPTSIINPVYNGTKAFLHFWTMALRTQVKDSNIRVIEIAPPTVETDLHRERANPEDNKKANNPVAMSLDEFMRDVVQGWKEDRDTIGAGPSSLVVDRWDNEFGPDYKKAAAAAAA